MEAISCLEFNFVNAEIESNSTLKRYPLIRGTVV